MEPFSLPHRLREFGPYQCQLESLRYAAQVIRKLPAATVWALEVTEEDTPQAPGSLNIYVPLEADRLTYRARMALGAPVETTDTYDTYATQESLAVSVIVSPSTSEKDPA